MKTPDQNENPLINEVIELRQRIAELEALENERTQTEKALRESEDRLRIILESVQTGIVIIDSETHRIIDANPIASKLIGAPKGQIIGSLCHKYMCPAEVGRCPITDLGQTVDNSERVLLTAGGGRCPVIKTVVPVVLGGRKHFLESFVDITERKQAEEVLREAEERYRLLFEISTNAVLIRDREGIIHLANPTAIRMLKASRPDEIIGKAYLDFVHPDDRPGSIDRIKRQIKAVQEEPGIDPACKVAPLREHRLLALDGETIYVESTGVAFWHQGQLWIQGNFHDITQRKQAEEALRKSEEQSRRMAHENAIVAEIGRIISSSLSIEDIYERFAEKARQLISFDWIAISIIDHEKGTFRNAYNSGDVIPGRGIMEEVPLAGSLTEEVMRKRSRRIIELEDTDEVASRFPKLSPFGPRGYRSFMAIPLTSDDQVVGALHIYSKRSKAFHEADASLGELIAAQIAGAITNTQLFQDRKRAEEALERSLSLLQATFDSTADGILVADRKGKLAIFNQKFLSLWGIPDSLAASRDDNQLLQYVMNQLQDPEIFLNRVKALYDQPEVESYEFLEFKDGRVFERYSKPQRIGEEIIGRVWSFRDVTERRRAEEALRRSEEKYRLLIQTSNDAIFIAQDGVVKFPNLKTEELLGYPADELVKTPFVNHIHPDDRAMVVENHIKRLKGQSLPSTYAFRARNKSGEEVWVEINAVRILWDGRPATLNFVRDISEKKKLEAQYLQAQKMEAVGTLAGGVAHDFNNLLMGIQGHASLMLLEVDPGHPHYKMLKSIEEQVKSGADLTWQLLGFARGGKFEVKPTDLNAITRKTSAMFGRTRKEISIQSKLQQDLWPVEVDRGQIQQVLLNLYVNAWQAMPSGGSLFLETKNVALDDQYRKPFYVKPGNYVKISVTDTGHGMDEKTQKRIFEPFFTTKEMGRGTGLGLATAYGIIKGHGGVINVYSEKGHGATFTIYLPASEKKIEKGKKSPEGLIEGEATVLLVDDEEVILNVNRMVLEKLGYKVLTARDGQEAVEVFGHRKDEIDLVLLDMIMPGIEGGKVLDILKGIHSDVKIILLSGYGMNDEIKKMMERGCRAFIQKPFDIGDFSRKIRDVLDGGEMQASSHPTGLSSPSQSHVSI